MRDGMPKDSVLGQLEQRHRELGRGTARRWVAVRVDQEDGRAPPLLAQRVPRDERGRLVGVERGAGHGVEVDKVDYKVIRKDDVIGIL